MAVLIAVGDVAPDRDDPAECFSLSAPVLRSADVAFCQLECNLTTRGRRMPQARHTHRGSPGTAIAMKEAGFDVVSFAGNHCMDWGLEGFDDTVHHLESAGLTVVGVGHDIQAARRARIVEADGVRIAFLACSSILPAAYWATPDRAGCAPMRAHTLYEQIELDQPGTPARIHTWAHAGDLDRLCTDIRDAAASADVVAVSVHWGIHFIPGSLADYQREVAYAAIDAGADLILGHHAHILKGVEIYRGKPILYSFGNFAMDLRMTPEHAASRGFKEVQALAPEWEPDFDSLYNFPHDSRKTVMLRAALSRNGVESLELLPAWINDNAQPEPLSREDSRYAEVLNYLRWCCEDQDLSTRFTDGQHGIAIKTEVGSG
jgi:poly-gamma-glutamate capsule biosynthesis protein CapA/YwtB (metallophosphatase superfamily)